MKTPTPYITLLTGAGLGLVLLIASTQATRTNAGANAAPSPAPAATAEPSGSAGGGGTAALKPVGPLPPIPGCDTGIAAAPDLSKRETAPTTVGGRPVSVGVPQDGEGSFVQT